MAATSSAINGTCLHNQALRDEPSGQLAFSESPTVFSGANPVSGSATATRIAFSSQPLAPVVPTCNPSLFFTQAPNLSSPLTCGSNSTASSSPLIFSRNKRAVSQFSITRALPLTTTSPEKPAAGSHSESGGINLSISVPPSKKTGGSLEVTLRRRKRAQSTAYGRDGRRGQPLKGPNGEPHQTTEKLQSSHIPYPSTDGQNQLQGHSALVGVHYRPSAKATKFVADNTEHIDNRLLSRTITSVIARMFPAKADRITDCYTKLSKLSSGSKKLVENNLLNKRLFHAYYKLSLKDGVGNLIVPNNVTTLEAYISFLEAHLCR
ncbi:Hypothetical protein DHA2_152004 [Giardia duodenalis]|uniref:Uncharacterized protein n=1 Tax=Giardia intestinalis TaxID=5741 RepID=V6TK56_GIAIN|nr:Hypothetical protein DHA2_152004 [Giardia intestinalis]